MYLANPVQQKNEIRRCHCVYVSSILSVTYNENKLMVNLQHPLTKGTFN